MEDSGSGGHSSRCWVDCRWSLFSLSFRTTLTEKDTIVLADFANTTGDAVFDDTLKQGLSVSAFPVALP